MRAVVLAGGYGGARCTAALRDHLASTAPGSTISVVVNTADDLRLHGLHISPDLDTIMYTLGDGLDSDRGWGRRDEAFRANEELAAHGAPTWFGLGDRDVATHLIRTQMREAGYSLTAVTEALSKRWELARTGIELLPMTDDRVETHVVARTPQGERALHFQEWWIRYGAELPTSSFLQVGIQSARPTPAVLTAVAEADVVIVAPSNPVVSIRPITSLPTLSDALRRASAPVVGISPIIAGAPLRGMADVCLAVERVDPTALGVAEYHGAAGQGGLLDGWILDARDEELLPEVSELGLKAAAVPSVMSDPEVADKLVRETLAVARECA